MKIEFVMVADAVQVEGGKLYVLGGTWNLLRCTSFPRPTQLNFAVSILANRKETGKRHKIRVSIADSEGTPLAPPIDGEFEIGASEESSAEVPTRAMFAMGAAVTVPNAGCYAITVKSGEAQATTYFQAIFTGTRIDLGGQE